MCFCISSSSTHPEAARQQVLLLLLQPLPLVRAAGAPPPFLPPPFPLCRVAAQLLVFSSSGRPEPPTLPAQAILFLRFRFRCEMHLLPLLLFGFDDLPASRLLVAFPRSNSLLLPAQWRLSVSSSSSSTSSKSSRSSSSSCSTYRSDVRSEQPSALSRWCVVCRSAGRDHQVAVLVASSSSSAKPSLPVIFIKIAPFPLLPFWVVSPFPPFFTPSSPSSLLPPNISGARAFRRGSEGFRLGQRACSALCQESCNGSSLF